MCKNTQTVQCDDFSLALEQDLILTLFLYLIIAISQVYNYVKFEPTGFIKPSLSRTQKRQAHFPWSESPSSDLRVSKKIDIRALLLMLDGHFPLVSENWSTFFFLEHCVALIFGTIYLGRRKTLFCYCAQMSSSDLHNILKDYCELLYFYGSHHKYLMYYLNFLVQSFLL